MHICFYQDTPDKDQWLAELRARLPQATVEYWTPDSPPADYGVAWAPPQELVDRQSGLRALFNIGAGVDRMLGLRLPPELPLVRLDDAGMASQMVEYVSHAVIRHTRGFDTYAAQAAEGRWQQHPARARSEFPVGVMGLGVLGQRVAQALRALGFPVAGWSRSARTLTGLRCYAGREQLDAFLAATRVLVCLLPLTPDTENILDRETLGRLKSGAFLVNVARGAHVVDADLLALLDSGHMAGAALDVFRTEPLPPGHPFWRHPGIRITPHISAQTLRADSIEQIAAKIVALERGLPIAGVVERSLGY